MDPTRVAADDDVALLTRAADGDLAAYGELTARHQRAALRVAAVICGSTDDASDIVQDALVELHSRLHTYRGTGSVRSWMLRVVANRAKNHVRGDARRRRRDDRDARLAIRNDDGADELAERRLEYEELAGALARLSERDREVLGCRFVVGLSEAETAETLGIPLGTVKSRAARALGRLAHELTPTGTEQGR